MRLNQQKSIHTLSIGFVLFALVLRPGVSAAQRTSGLKEILTVSLKNYGEIKAKNAYAEATRLTIKQAKLDYLPNLNIAAQADYGTANGQNGPAYGFGPVGIASSGLPLGAQNWNAAFGSLYLANVNWDFFAFGRSAQKIKTAEVKYKMDFKDMQQEIFEHQVRVSAAYLNLLAAQRLSESYRRNLQRADTLRAVIVRKAKKDLLAGVDSSQANAEVSNAKSMLYKAMTFEDEQNNSLIKLIGVNIQHITADTIFIAQLPKDLTNINDSLLDKHPEIEFYKSRVNYNDQQVQYLRTLNYPVFSLGAATQARGSGFASSYTALQPNYSESLSRGLDATRVNYVIAIGITWNLTQPFRIRQQIRTQNLLGEGLNDELEQVTHELKTQVNLANQKLKNALADYYETPVQVKAAYDSYNQKLVLYNHGLTNLVDLTQTLYVLVRAETDRDIAYNNVWQALLLKAGATGNFDLFYRNL